MQNSLPYHPLLPPLPSITTSDLRPPRPLTPPTPMLNPENRHPNRTNQPQKRIHQINPNRILHPLDPPIPLRVLLDIHIAKQAEQRDPEDEEDRVPYEDEGDAAGEGDEVEERRDGGEGGGDFCVDLEREGVSIFAHSV